MDAAAGETWGLRCRRARKGRWVVAFSSAERLGRYAGNCECFSTSGADLLGLLPDDIGVLLDPQDPHAAPVPPKVARAAMPAR